MSGIHPPSHSSENGVTPVQKKEHDVTQMDFGGAPIEVDSPMGKEIGWWSIVFLNLSMMVGTGIFSTPGTILKQTGSVGLALIYWCIGL